MSNDFDYYYKIQISQKIQLISEPHNITEYQKFSRTKSKSQDHQVADHRIRERSLA